MRSNYKLKLMSKRLKSGRCQIKFYVCSKTKKNMYGYLLADAGATLREVVGRIEHKIKSLDSADQYYHANLYNLASRHDDQDQIILFNN